MVQNIAANQEYGVFSVDRVNDIDRRASVRGCEFETPFPKGSAQDGVVYDMRTLHSDATGQGLIVAMGVIEHSEGGE